MTDQPPILLDGETLSLRTLALLAHGDVRLGLSDPVWQRIAGGRDIVERALTTGRAYYGVNTGIGSQKDRRLREDEIAAFNAAMLVGESTGMPGPSFCKTVVRAALAVLLNNAASGRMGLRVQTVDQMVTFFNESAMPEITCGTSTGVSDLGPLAQLSRAIFQGGGPAEAFPLAAKEAVSLINNNAFALAHGGLVLDRVARLCEAFDLSVAASLEAHRGNLSYLRAEMAPTCRNPHQRRSFEAIRAALSGSSLWQSGQWRHLQDPLSFRVAMRVNGAVRMAHDMAERVTNYDINSICDNPVASPELDEMVTGFNMDSTPVTCVMDMLRQSLAMAAHASLERGLKLQNPVFSGLPAALSDPERAESGTLNLILPHLTAARMAELCNLAAPVLLDCPYGVADGIVDVSGMAPLSAMRSEEVVDLAWQVLAHEVLTALWVMDLRRLDDIDLGQRVRRLRRALRQFLPAGREGCEVFDMATFSNRFRSTAEELFQPY